MSIWQNPSVSRIRRFILAFIVKLYAQRSIYRSAYVRRPVRHFGTIILVAPRISSFCNNHIILATWSSTLPLIPQIYNSYRLLFWPCFVQKSQLSESIQDLFCLIKLTLHLSRVDVKSTEEKQRVCCSATLQAIATSTRDAPKIMNRIYHFLLCAISENYLSAVFVFDLALLDC